MTTLSENIRARLENMELEECRTTVKQAIRRALRYQIHRYCQIQYIIDFDAVEVEQTHRDKRDNWVAAATTKFNQANNAADMQELLAIYDSISKYLR